MSNFTLPLLFLMPIPLSGAIIRSSLRLRSLYAFWQSPRMQTGNSSPLLLCIVIMLTASAAPEESEPAMSPPLLIILSIYLISPATLPMLSNLLARSMKRLRFALRVSGSFMAQTIAA